MSRLNIAFVWVRILVLGVFVSAGAMLHSAGTDVWGFRKQLAAAQEETDKPAIIELSRRIVEADPQDSATWETLARTWIPRLETPRLSARSGAYRATASRFPGLTYSKPVRRSVTGTSSVTDR